MSADLQTEANMTNLALKGIVAFGAASDILSQVTDYVCDMTNRHNM